ncbi:MAG: transglycosylase SLT domain-containing protein [Deltaproteobacteria bacterium]|nr:transglycosylase SLT domain-containing protein [Deltaproteobacteria bacterium]
MPEDLAYLALIESGFNPYAYSRAKAVGMWQFIRGTGLKYGLKINAWVDERRNPEKATISAVNYLKDLYAMFGSWELATASYNAGEGKIIKAINMHNTKDFWTISQKKYLKRETKDYVPKFLAAILVAKEPEKYGFYDIEYEESVEYEIVTVPGATDLRAVAKAGNSTLEEIKALNPELLRMFTPPNAGNYEIKIPHGSKDAFYDNFAMIPQKEKRNFITHKVKNGQTISKIAKAYGIPSDSIIYLNGSSNVRTGQEIVIPVMANFSNTKIGTKTVTAKKELKRLARKEINYTVKKGDTITGIAREFGTTIDAIKQWNGIDDTARIFHGDKIRLFPSITRLDYPKNAIAR